MVRRKHVFLRRLPGRGRGSRLDVLVTKVKRRLVSDPWEQASAVRVQPESSMLADVERFPVEPRSGELWVIRSGTSEMWGRVSS